MFSRGKVTGYVLKSSLILLLLCLVLRQFLKCRWCNIVHFLTIRQKREEKIETRDSNFPPTQRARVVDHLTFSSDTRKARLGNHRKYFNYLSIELITDRTLLNSLAGHAFLIFIIYFTQQTSCTQNYYVCGVCSLKSKISFVFILRLVWHRLTSWISIICVWYYNIYCTLLSYIQSIINCIWKIARTINRNPIKQDKMYALQKSGKKNK